MAFTYQSINMDSIGGSDAQNVKVSTDDTNAGFLEDKIEAGSNKVVVTVDTPGGDEKLHVDLDQTNIDHDQLLNYDIDEHRTLDDASTTTTSLWSSDKIQTELDGKVNAATPMTDNKLVKSVGTTGVDVEATGIDVDDSDNVTGINDLTIDGDLTVNGTTTSVNTDTLDVEDANITVNKNGTQASADAADAGLTVEMSDATDVALGYDSTLSSKFKAGEVGSESEVITANHTQTLLNKTLDADNNTVSNIETDNLKSGVLQTDISGAVSDTNLASSQAVKTYVDDQIATIDDASEITYTPDTLSDWDSSTDPGNTDDALDQLADRTTTAESSLSTHLGVGAAKHAADQITNTPAGNIAATTVQAAIDELDTEKYVAADFDGDFDTRLGTSNVTDLSDVTDVGSGAIITGAERTTLGTALQPADPSSDLNHAQGDTDDWTVADNATVAAHLDELASRSTSNALPANDIAETEFTYADNQTDQDVTGLLFANTDVRSFVSQVSVERDSLNEVFQLTGIQLGSDWAISEESVGDDTGLSFSITSAGQVQYSSTNTGDSGKIRFRAETTEASPPAGLTWNIQGGGLFSTTGTSIEKTGGTAGASNIQSIEEISSGDFELNYTMDTVHPGDTHIGLDISPYSTGDNLYAQIDFAIRILFGSMWIRENGSNKGMIAPASDGDTFAIKVVGTTVTYYQNGSLVYTSLNSFPGYPVRVTALLSDVGDRLSNISFT